jgi:hypothetical protein
MFSFFSRSTARNRRNNHVGLVSMKCLSIRAANQMKQGTTNVTHKFGIKWVWNPFRRTTSIAASGRPVSGRCSPLPPSTERELGPSRHRDRHRHSTPVQSKRGHTSQRGPRTELEQLALDFRAEKRSWKEAAERAKVSRLYGAKPT